MASIDKQMQLLGSQARAAAETLAFSTFEQRSLAVSEGAMSISNQIDLILSANEMGNIELEVPIVEKSKKTLRKDLIFLLLLFTYISIFFVLRKFKI